MHELASRRSRRTIIESHAIKLKFYLHFFGPLALLNLPLSLLSSACCIACFDLCCLHSSCQGNGVSQSLSRLLAGCSRHHSKLSATPWAIEFGSCLVSPQSGIYHTAYGFASLVSSPFFATRTNYKPGERCTCLQRALDG